LVIVDIDEKKPQPSANGRGRATLIAILVDALTEMGALAIGFRRVFPRARSHSPR